MRAMSPAMPIRLSLYHQPRTAPPRLRSLERFCGKSEAREGIRLQQEKSNAYCSSCLGGTLCVALGVARWLPRKSLRVERVIWEPHPPQRKSEVWLDHGDSTRCWGTPAPRSRFASSSDCPVGTIWSSPPWTRKVGGSRGSTRETGERRR